MALSVLFSYLLMPQLLNPVTAVKYVGKFGAFLCSLFVVLSQCCITLL